MQWVAGDNSEYMFPATQETLRATGQRWGGITGL
jgi:hypothetical protein